MIDMLKKRMMPIVGGGTGVTSWTHVDDAASATVAALERGAVEKASRPASPPDVGLLLTQRQ
jgi:nucleoside-diphosphate-sugar epimerase